MSGLVLELQRDAADPSLSVANLLRKALVVSRKLQVKDIDEWIQKELSGYGEEGEAPEYRTIKGQPMVWNPVQGRHMPLEFRSTEMAKVVSERICGQSISELEELLSDRGNATTYLMPYSEKTRRMLMDSMQRFPLEPTLVVQRTSILRIVESVRNAILDWALTLESEKVVGEGMTFTQEEQARARGADIVHQTIQNQVVIHSMVNSQLQQGSTHSQQTFTNSATPTEALIALVESIRDLLQLADWPAQTAASLEADLSTIEAQAKAPEPKPVILQESLRSVRSILENAAGSVLGTVLPQIPGVVSQIAKLLS
ncbi:hypothetical protein [Cupriavidus taiwanensis]|uniref:AbiTii domain-containing protein n=1 Tax=Cupriavidus taiwanensis TaxID=164546 RepID=UPI0039C1A60D